MLEFLLILLGLSFGNKNAATVFSNEPDFSVQTTMSVTDQPIAEPGDTGGETGQTPPPKR